MIGTGLKIFRVTLEENYYIRLFANSSCLLSNCLLTLLVNYPFVSTPQSAHSCEGVSLPVVTASGSIVAKISFVR